jgi:macrolide-specific efflux system membrane fusion protein
MRVRQNAGSGSKASLFKRQSKYRDVPMDGAHGEGMKGLIGFGIAIAAFSIVLAGCEVKTAATGSTDTAERQIAQAPAQPTTAKADRRDIVGYRLLPGKVYAPANASADVVASTTAPVQTVDVKQGDHVRKGQTLVTLANGQQENYQQAKSAYDTALAAYNQALAQYEQPVKDIQHQLEDAKSSERTIRQSTPPDGDASALQQATAARRALEDQVKVVQAQARTNEVPYKTQLDAAKLAESQARSGVNAATIESPISGDVVSLTVASGQTLSARTTIAKIVDLAALSIKSDVIPADVSFVKKGTAVAVVFGDYPDRKFDGHVLKVDTLPADQHDGKVEYEATIEFKNSDGMVKPNSVVRSVGVVIGKRRGVVTVPVDAVGRDSTGKPTVMISNNGNWTPVVVDIGMTDGNFVEVKSGVHDGDSVQVVPNKGQWIIDEGMAATS